MFCHIKHYLLIITLSAALTGCTSAQQPANSVEKKNSVISSNSSLLNWYKKPGTLEIDDFDNITMIYSGSGYNAYPEQNGYSPTWLDVNATDLVGGKHYTENAIIGISNDQKHIYDFNGSDISGSSFHNIYRDDILGAYVYDEYTDSTEVHYFDKYFKMHSTSVDGIGGDISGDEAVYSNGKVYYNDSSISSADDYAGSTPVIIPVSNSFSEKQENEFTFSEKSFTPDGYVILQKEKDPVFIPEGMIPAYIKSIQGKDLQDPKDDSYNTSFVNDVVKLLDKDNKIRLWRYSTQSYISNDAFDDATFYEEGYIGVRKNNKWAFMDLYSHLITGYIFDKVSEVCKGHAYVIYQKKAGILKVPS